MNNATTSDFDVQLIREQFPILRQQDKRGKQVVFLDNGASTQKPVSVIQKTTEVYEQYYANAYRGVYQFGQKVDDELELTRRAVQQLIRAETPEQISFTSGTTMSLNLIAQGYGRVVLKPGDEILLTIMEHHANLVPWQMIARQTGAVVKYLPLHPDGTLSTNQLDQLLTERTRIVSVTGMSNVLGTVVDLKSLSRQVHDAGAIFVVDAAQLISHAQIDVVADEIDFLTFSGHEIYGPSGVEIMYGKAELLDRMEPLLGGGHMIDQVFPDHSTWAPPPAKFEAGTLPIAQAIALRPALELVQTIGYEAIARHEHSLLRSGMEKLQQVPGLKILGPASEHRGAIISFTMEGAHPQDLAFLLNRANVCVRHGHHCTMPLHQSLGIDASVRASFAFYNTHEEIDELVAALFEARKRLRLN